ncbi:MAG: aminotransferase class I/II-fold pyridoxal phosphate-dependent enzyme [Oscillospiraceae bacterium]|nr:aminotransferase class I/II-fold pyridoxal phosphate-dependent enzyme [Oscillospiraceae bacterium]
MLKGWLHTLDLFEKCEKFTAAREVMDAGIYPYFHALSTYQDTVVTIEGRRTIMLGSNNYMGLTCDTRVMDAAIEAVKKFGSGCSGSRFLNGTLELHNQLEEALASFLNKESTLTFSTGFQTNLGVLSAIAGPRDIIYSDRQNHASIVDGNRLSFARVLKYAHNDMDELREKLERSPADAGKLIVTDGVFSMEGDIARLPDIVALAKRFGARVMVDDAHGLGMIGENGRGTANHFGLEDEVDIIMGTFSKSLASLGGYVAAKENVTHYIKHNSRPFIFSASIPPACAGAAFEALRIMKSEPDRPIKLKENGDYLRAKFREVGLTIGDSETAIVPVMTYDTIRTFKIHHELLMAGVYCNPVVAPAVNDGECLLRTSCTATHTREQLDEAVAIFKKVFDAA